MPDGYEDTDVQPGRSSLAGAISSAIVHATKEHSGLGPPRCRTYLDDNLVIVLMRGGYSRLENTLFEDGKWLDVRTMRHTFQDTMAARYTEIIERMTGRMVVAFMSASHQEPDLQMETFVLEPENLDPRSPSPA